MILLEQLKHDPPSPPPPPPPPNPTKRYCRFGNFRVTFISRFFDFRIIREVLNCSFPKVVVHRIAVHF